MPADRLHARHAGLDQRLTQVGGRADAVAQVVLVDRLAQRLLRPAGQAGLGSTEFLSRGQIQITVLEEHGAAIADICLGAPTAPSARVGSRAVAGSSGRRG